MSTVLQAEEQEMHFGAVSEDLRRLRVSDAAPSFAVSVPRVNRRADSESSTTVSFSTTSISDFSKDNLSKCFSVASAAAVDAGEQSEPVEGQTTFVADIFSQETCNFRRAKPKEEKVQRRPLKCDGGKLLLLTKHKRSQHKNDELRRKKMIEQMQRRLRLLHHGCKCAEVSCQMKLCGKAKALWEHVSACCARPTPASASANRCIVPHCRSSRAVLAHHAVCRLKGQEWKCEVCGPVMRSCAPQPCQTASSPNSY